METVDCIFIGLIVVFFIVAITFLCMPADPPPWFCRWSARHDKNPIPKDECPRCFEQGARNAHWKNRHWTC